MSNISFLEIAGAEWVQATWLLHLRGALKEEARDCVKAQGIGGILQPTRARFGLSQKEARARFAGLNKEAKTSLQEHASEVQTDSHSLC